MASFPPKLLREQPPAGRLVLTVVLPASFGLLCGALLGSSGAGFPRFAPPQGPLALVAFGQRRVDQVGEVAVGEPGS